MNNITGNMEEVLDRSICGFHQYILSGSAKLSYVSSNLCEMSGYTREELMREGYTVLVHSGDREVFCDTLESFKEGEEELTLNYRMVKKDGSICYVSDTMSRSGRAETGYIISSVLTDITDIKKENDNLQFLNETIPCGFLKYTCDKQPKLTYINEQMRSILRFPKVRPGEVDYLDMYKDNILLMIPMEERRRFLLYLGRVYSKEVPIAGEMTIMRCDGTRGYLFGWVTKTINEEGIEEFQSVCMDITERQRTKNALVTGQYLKALSDIYEKIYEYDFSNMTIKYVHSKGSDTFGRIQNIPMQMEEATNQWIKNSVYMEDRVKVKEFFENVFRRRNIVNGKRPLQICFRSVASDGEIKKYTGIFIKVNTSLSLFCCRDMKKEQEANELRSENITLKNMQELVMEFNEGVVAFEVLGDTVKPLYTSDNVCNFFGYTKEEWITLSEKSHSIKEFIANSGMEYDDIEELFATGEAEFSYFDMKWNTSRRIKAICSQKYSDDSMPYYVMLYHLESDSHNEVKKHGVSIRTFGYFDVFVDDKPIAFRSQKSKELFALLVDRRGGYVSSEEAISFLWEDETVNSVTLARYRKVALRLKNMLEEYGISEVVEAIDGKRRIVTDKVNCDLYDYLTGKEEYAQLFKGSYLTNYSWGENTLAELTGDAVFDAED